MNYKKEMNECSFHPSLYKPIGSYSFLNTK